MAVDRLQREEFRQKIRLVNAAYEERREHKRLRSAFAVLFLLISFAVVNCAQSTRPGQGWLPFPSLIEEADALECPPAGGQQSSWKAVPDDVFLLISSAASPLPVHILTCLFFNSLPCTCTIEINSDNVKRCKDAWSSFLPEMRWTETQTHVRCQIPPRLLISLRPSLCKVQNDVNCENLWNVSNTQMPSLSCHHHYDLIWLSVW